MAAKAAVAGQTRSRHIGTMVKADPLSDLVAAIALLAETGNPAAIRVAEALANWLAGNDCLENALGARRAAVGRLGARPGDSHPQHCNPLQRQCVAA